MLFCLFYKLEQYDILVMVADGFGDDSWWLLRLMMCCLSWWLLVGGGGWLWITKVGSLILASGG